RRSATAAIQAAPIDGPGQQVKDGPAASAPGLLGDTPERDYSRKLQLFNAFAEPELRLAISGLGIQAGRRILDAGCGTGEALCWLSEAAGHRCEIVGIDLATAHVAAARRRAPRHALVQQADLMRLPAEIGELDLIWSINTLNHLH